MTIKETIAKFHVDYLKSKLQKKKATKNVLKNIQKEIEIYSAGEFKIGAAGKGGNWDVTPNTLFDDTITSRMPVKKIEIALGKGRHNESISVLKMEGADWNIYYYDNLGLLTVVQPRLKVTPIEKFVEVESQ